MNAEHALLRRIIKDLEYGRIVSPEERMSMWALGYPEHRKRISNHYLKIESGYELTGEEAAIIQAIWDEE